MPPASARGTTSSSSGDVGEEGLGDLRGVRHLFASSRHRSRFRAFLTVDSPQVDGIVSGGVGSRRYRVTFRGPGGHSYAAFGLVNPMYAMAEAARGLAAVEVRVPNDPAVFGATMTTQWLEWSQQASSNAIEWTVANAAPGLGMALLEGHPQEASGHLTVHLAHVLRFESQ